MHKILFIALWWLAVGLSGRCAGPVDKSGVKASVISLPSGAGSIEGLGESFEPQLNTGGSSYGVSVAVPPGRAGLVPSISIDYNSYSGNGVCGVGWSLDFISIKRQTDKGFPEYDSGDTFVFQGEELVPLSNAGQDWRCENERGFQRFRRMDVDADGLPDAWEITERDGIRHTLGQYRGENGRWSAVEHPEKTALPSFDRTYSWMVDTTTDLHGNRIDYEYTRGTGVLYPSRISYAHLGDAAHEVLFQYESRPDAFDDYRPTFSARLDRRLTRIEVRSRGQLVRAYNFAYAYQEGDLLPDIATLQATYLDLGVTLLKRVVQVDRSGNDANYLPPLIFIYSGLDLTKAEQRAFAAPPELDLAEPNGRVQLADVDGDALPDLFATSSEGAGIAQRVCLNRGETRVSGRPQLLFAPAKLVLGSSPIDLAQPDAIVHDPRAKGLVDLSSLVDDGPNKRLDTFGNRAQLDVVNEDRLGFSPDNLQVTLLRNPPAFVSYSDASTRQMDVNFDKSGDFIHLEPSFGAMKVNTFYVARGGNWVPSESMLPPSYPLANTFAGPNGEPNPCVHLADMNGDRMLDLVCLAPAPSGTGQRISVSYWPLCGLGRYANERKISAAAADTFDLGSADLRDVLIDDFTGDGLADVMVLDGSGPETVITLRVNIAGQRWSPPYVRSGLPRYAPRAAANPTVLRLADVNANGSVDLIFRNTASQDGWVYLELLPGGTASLLTGLDNSLGKRTTIVYGAAAEDEQRARETGHPWRTFAPIPLQVVRQIRVTCGQDLNGDGKEDAAVSEFHYRDPYYDGFEREFRGFAFAERIDYGDDFLFDPLTGLMQASSGWDRARTPTGQLSGPSLVTRFRFHTGAGDQKDNDDYGGNPPAFRLTDEFTILGGREEESLKGRQWIEEKVDPAVLHSALDAGFDAGCEAAATATTTEEAGRLTPDTYVYTRSLQEWTIKRLYRPDEPVPYFADQDANGLLEDYRNAPVAPIPSGSFTSAGAVVLPGNGHSVSFAFANRTRTEVREANGLLSSALGYPEQSALVTLKTFDYDDYGNQISLRDFGIDGGTFDDERFTTTTYAHGGNALSLWIIDKPDTVTVTDEEGVLVSKQIHFYDGSPFAGVQGQIQDRALLSRTLEHIDAVRTIQTSRSRFDAFGNVIETRDPLGNIRRLTWDPVFQTHPIAETIVVGGGSPDLVISAAYDLGFGVVTNSTDLNGQVTTYSFDSFARLVKIVRPGDTEALPTQAFGYQPADPVRGRAFVYDPPGNLTLVNVPLGSASRVTTRQREIAGQSGEYVTASYTDGGGKALAIIEEGEQTGTWIVKKAISYNLRLKSQSEWLPFQITSPDLPQFAAIWPAGRPPSTDGINPAIVAADTYYDPLARGIRTVNPPETWGGSRRETANRYLPFQRHVFDEEDLRSSSPHFDTPHLQFSDGLNRLIAVEEVVKITDSGERGPVARWRTEYAYDLNDQIIRLRDSQGNIKTMAFDALKRMTNMNDPDRGVMTLVYDDSSNLRETVDAKGQKIVFTYDGVNRLRTEDYRDGSSLSNDVEYFYDVPQPDLDLGDGTRGVGSNTKGQLAFVRDLSGENHFSYDARARLEWEIKRIPDRLHSQLVSYRTRFQYDSADRVQQLTYPDGDRVAQSYNSRNLLTRIYGASFGDVIGAISYRPSGQISSIRHGNQVGTACSYDPRLRLTSLDTANGTGSLIDFDYTFDAVSNIERIDDRRSLAGSPESDQRFNTQIFTYDSLYRLTGALYPRLGAAATNNIAYRYDRIGNLLGQTSDIAHEENGLSVTHFGPMNSGGTLGRFNRNGRSRTDPPGPHALTSVGDPQAPARTYPYDANGNMIGIDGLRCEWDFKDRLTAAENDQMRAVYSYDYADRRITKTVHWKNPTPDKGDEASSLNSAWRSTTTHYINAHFEVRDHDAYVKYVCKGDTRVARVTVNLSGATAVQHLRLQRGWNLVCLRVGGMFSALDPDNNSDLGASTYWSGTGVNNGYTPIRKTTSVPAGVSAWVYARRDTTIILTGLAAPPILPNLTGNQFYGNVLTEPINLQTAFPAEAWVAQFDPTANRWRNRFSSVYGLTAWRGQSTLLLPGKSSWIKLELPSSTVLNQSQLQVRYYHPDHLGSTAVMTDAQGALIEESSYYPFGTPRYSYRPAGTIEPYGFTRKERDQESGLDYFEARYLATGLSRFSRVDPLASKMPKEWLSQPQKGNLYAYCGNNPLRFVDPTGLDGIEKDTPAASASEPNQSSMPKQESVSSEPNSSPPSQTESGSMSASPALAQPPTLPPPQLSISASSAGVRGALRFASIVVRFVLAIKGGPSYVVPPTQVMPNPGTVDASVPRGTVGSGGGGAGGGGAGGGGAGGGGAGGGYIERSEAH